MAHHVHRTARLGAWVLISEHWYNEREVKGIVSWRSIGARYATKVSGRDVQSYMDDHHEIPKNASLFSAIQIILEHDCVLVRADDRRISGIVTASDIAREFETISTPFLLLAEIENNLRSIIEKKLSKDDIIKSCGENYLPNDFTSVSDLTFGNYVKILEYPANWTKMGWYLDRVKFCSELATVNNIRNDVMHFDPDPPSPDGGCPDLC